MNHNKLKTTEETNYQEAELIYAQALSDLAKIRAKLDFNRPCTPMTQERLDRLVNVAAGIVNAI